MSDVKQYQVVEENNAGVRSVDNRRVTHWPSWSPTQVVVLVIGLVYIVVGGVALARAGLHFNDVPATHAQVAGLGFTSMSATITLIVGVVLACGCSAPDVARGVGWIFGAVFIAFGLIVALAPSAFTNMWGFTAVNGMVIVVSGGILVLAAALLPAFGRTTSVRRRSRSRPRSGASGVEQLIVGDQRA
jgi:uncharacterized membrane protein YidH (DUF202 family)